MTNITSSVCNKRMGLVATVFGVMVVLVGWAIAAGRFAQDDAADVEKQMVGHEAAQEVWEEGVAEKLDDLKTSVKGMDGKLDRMLRGRSGFGNGE